VTPFNPDTPIRCHYKAEWVKFWEEFPMDKLAFMRRSNIRRMRAGLGAAFSDQCAKGLDLISRMPPVFQPDFLRDFITEVLREGQCSEHELVSMLTALQDKMPAIEDSLKKSPKFRRLRRLVSSQG